MKRLGSLVARIFLFAISTTPLFAVAQPVLRYTFDGTETSERFGSALACALPFGTGSVTSEMLIGRPGRNPNGRSTLIHGGDGLTVIFDRDGLTGANHGVSVSALDDLNGDGLSDVIVGSSTLNLAEIIFSPSGTNTLPLNDSLASSSSEFGHSVAGLFSDVNNNGTDDVLVSAPRHQATPGPDVGFFSVLDGLTGASLRNLEGTNSGDRLGQVITSIDDFNSDGKRDVLISAPGANSNAGRVFVYSSVTGPTPLLTIDGTSGPNSEFGHALAAIPDADQGTRQDILVGAPSSQNAGTDAGQVVLYSGSTGVVLCRIDGTSLDKLGFSVAPVGDQNNDGIEDFAVGAPAANNGTGKVEIYTYNPNTSQCVLLYTLAGTVAGGDFGYSLAGKPGGFLQCDIDNDKKTDFGVGGLTDAGIQEDVGSAYFYVHPTPTPTATPTATPTPFPTPTPTATPSFKAPTSASFWFRIGTDGTMTTRTELNRDPGSSCVISLLGRRTTSDRGNRGPIVTLVNRKPAERLTRFNASNLRKARAASAGRSYLFHILAKIECQGEKEFYSNVFSRKLNCGKKPPVSVQDWERQAIAAFNPSALKNKKRQTLRKR